MGSAANEYYSIQEVGGSGPTAGDSDVDWHNAVLTVVGPVDCDTFDRHRNWRFKQSLEHLVKTGLSAARYSQGGVGALAGSKRRMREGDMRREALLAWLFGLLVAMPLPAQEPSLPRNTGSQDNQFYPFPKAIPAPAPRAARRPSGCPGRAVAMARGSLGNCVGTGRTPRDSRGAQGRRPNGQVYHPNFSLDLNFNFWIWRSQRLYMFADMSLWGEKGEYGVTNARDGFMGTSKREFDLSGGAAVELRRPLGGASLRLHQQQPQSRHQSGDALGFTDGFGLENRYYLSPEYAKLGETGFDVARATFLSIGYYPSKDMVGNNGQTFEPGLLLRLT